jgi:hypothetical protein
MGVCQGAEKFGGKSLMGKGLWRKLTEKRAKKDGGRRAVKESEFS